MRLSEKYKSSRLYYIFNFHEEHAYGRSIMLISATLSTGALKLISGVFYTGFLIANDIDIVNVGVINFIPYLTSAFCIFSPYVLERFRKRKAILITGRLIYYTLYILGVTVMPYFIKDKAAKVIAFAVIIFVSNAVNSLTNPGFSVWHINFIPDSVRADYFGNQQIVTCTLSGLVVLFSGLAADALSSSPYEKSVLFVLRYIAYAMMLIEIYVLSKPREYPYEKKAQPRLRNIFTLPLANKKFLLSVSLVFSWTFCQTLSTSFFEYYQLNSAGIKYTFFGVIEMAYVAFLLVLSNPWRREIRKRGWVKVFALTGLAYCPTVIVYAFTNAVNYLYVMLPMRLAQHFLGVGLNLTYANLPFINLPREDGTNYMSFYLLFFNVFGFLGVLTGTAFVAAVKTVTLPLTGTVLEGAQVLIIIQGVLQGLISLAALFLAPRLEVDER